MISEANCSWPKVKLGNYVDLLTGFPFKSSQYCGDIDSIRLLRGDNVGQGFLRWDSAKKWPYTGFNGFAKFILDVDDVILAMDRPWIEAGLKYAWVTEKDLPCLLVQRVARLRGKNGLLTRFLRYVIADQSFTDYIKPIVTGVAVPHISGKQIQDYQFILPPKETQSKIVAILSAYDDLIENNTRRIKILEEMAQRLQRDWFVHFRFPGHEKVRMVDSPLGRIPEGWEVKTLATFGKIITGKTPSKKVPEYFGDYLPFIKTPDMHGKMFCIDAKERLSELGVSSQSNKTLPPNSLCVSCIGTAGIVAITGNHSQTNQQINSVVLVDVSDREFLYFALLDLKETINQHGANGATMVNLNKDKFEALKIIFPERKMLINFHKATFSLFDQIKMLQIKNANLGCTRDLLLPKLIMRELNIDGLNIK